MRSVFDVIYVIIWSAQTVLVMFKLVNLVDLSWWLVFAPIWAPLAVTCCLTLVVVCFLSVTGKI